MKKVIASIALACISLTAAAQHHPRGYPHAVYKPGMGWVVPMIISGVITYEIVKQQQPQVIIQQQQVVCTEWKEIQTSDGKIYRERSCKEN
jgi:hypothetical protein